MPTIRISKTIKPYLQKAKDSALLAVEIYNKPAIKFRSSGYLTLMVIAWTALFHAIFIRKGAKPYYKDKNGQFQKMDDDFKHWDISECVKQFWENDSENPVRKNIEFFIPLRNKIEHRHLPELDSEIFGECQALLLNFDSLIGQYFGQIHQLRESLSFSLQLFPSGDSFSQAVKGNKNIADLKKFIDNYRSMLSAQAISSGQFAFKAFLIQVAANQSSDALSIQFVQYDKLTPEQQEEIERLSVMIKMKPTQTGNDGLMKPTEVIRIVQNALGNIKLERNTGIVDKFNPTTHQRCWKRYGVRPASKSKKPDATSKEHCIYDKVHKDYLYTQAWVDFLIVKMKDDAEYLALYQIG